MTAPDLPVPAPSVGPTEHRCDGSGRLSKHEVAVLRDQLEIVLNALGNATHARDVGVAALYLWTCLRDDGTEDSA